MIPVCIELENFQAFKGKHIIDLPLGLTQIKGQNLDNEGAESNRAGKTSLLSAISVCLYGRSPLVVRSKGFVNKDEKWASGMVTFDQGLSIKRFIKHSEYGNSIHKGKNGVNFSPITQEEIDKMFGSFDAFVATCFFGTNYSDFLEKVLKKPAEAKELLTSLLPKLQIFDQALEWVKKKISDNDNQLRELDTKESYFKGQIDSWKGINFVAKKADWEEEQANVLGELRQKIMEYESELKSFGKLPDEKKLNKEMDDWTVGLTECNKEISSSREEYGKVEASRKALLENKKRLLEESKTVSSGICPTCGQELPRKTSVTPQSYKEKLEKIESSILSYEKRCKDVTGEIGKLKNGADFSTKKIIEIKELLKPISQIANIQFTIKNKQQELAKAEQEVNPYIEQEKNNLYEIAKVEIQLKLIGKSRSRINDFSQYHQFLLKAFGPRGIKNFVFDEIIYKLTEMSKPYLDFMTNGTIQIKFDPRKEKKMGGFTETIGLEVSNNGITLDDFLLWSSSERKKIALTVDLAMNDLLSDMFSSPMSFLVFDEAMDSLDRMGIELFCKLLRTKLKNIGSIFVVTHNPMTEDYFDKTIEVVKENGISRVGERSRRGRLSI